MPITNLVRTISTVHHATRVIQKRGPLQLMESAFTPENFPTFLAVAMTASGVFGFYVMDEYQRRRWEQRDAVYDQVWEEHAKQAQMSRKSSTVVVAMLENAMQSSWQENLDNAFEAQEHFMLGSKGRSEPKFLNKIKERSAEIGEYSRKYTNRIKDQVADMIETQYTTRYAMRSSLDPRIREQVRFVPGE